MATLQELINQPINSNMFRRAYIRRRQLSDGKYEADWQEITEFVTKWGTISRGVDDLKVNTFQQSGINLAVRNNTGAFSPEHKPASLWYGYLTRYRTLVKIEAGYADSAGTELPTNPVLGVFVVSDEILISGDANTVQVPARSLTSIFDEVKISDVAAVTSTQTASQLIAKIRDHSDGSGNLVFQQFISSGAWNIQSTSIYYNPTTTAAEFEAKSCWDFMTKLAESEGFVVFINRSGGLEFVDRTEATTASQFSFLGLGNATQNVIALEEYKEPTSKLYTYFTLKYLEADTTTSFLTVGSTSTVDPSSTAWKYGSRAYPIENTMVANTNAAQSLINGVADALGTIKDEVRIKAKFVPDLEVLSKVDLSYQSPDATGAVWDGFFWGAAWAPESGIIFDFRSHSFKTLSLVHDLDNFTTRPALREN